MASVEEKFQILQQQLDEALEALHAAELKASEACETAKRDREALLLELEDTRSVLEQEEMMRNMMEAKQASLHSKLRDMKQRLHLLQSTASELASVRDEVKGAWAQAERQLEETQAALVVCDQQRKSLAERCAQQQAQLQRELELRVQLTTEQEALRERVTQLTNTAHILLLDHGRHDAQHFGAESSAISQIHAAADVDTALAGYVARQMEETKRLIDTEQVVASDLGHSLALQQRQLLLQQAQLTEVQQQRDALATQVAEFENQLASTYQQLENVATERQGLQIQLEELDAQLQDNTELLQARTHVVKMLQGSIVQRREQLAQVVEQQQQQTRTHQQLQQELSTHDQTAQTAAEARTNKLKDDILFLEHMVCVLCVQMTEVMQVETHSHAREELKKELERSEHSILQLSSQVATLQEEYETVTAQLQEEREKHLSAQDQMQHALQLLTPAPEASRSPSRSPAQPSDLITAIERFKTSQLVRRSSFVQPEMHRQQHVEQQEMFRRQLQEKIQRLDERLSMLHESDSDDDHDGEDAGDAGDGEEDEDEDEDDG